MTLHPCDIIYAASPHKPRYGEVAGICRITGRSGVGLVFSKWVRDTFTDLNIIHPGDIICNEAIFCFEEASEFLRDLTGKEKPQRFRNYSHFVIDGVWHVRDKGQKSDMLNFLLSRPEVCVIAESGQRHLVFKHKPGTWQFEDITVMPDVDTLLRIHTNVSALSVHFSNDEIASGQYQQSRIMKAGFTFWHEKEAAIKSDRGTPMFGIALFFSKIAINKDGTAYNTSKPAIIVDESADNTAGEPAAGRRESAVPVVPLTLF